MIKFSLGIKIVG